MWCLKTLTNFFSHKPLANNRHFQVLVSRALKLHQGYMEKDKRSVLEFPEGFEVEEEEAAWEVGGFRLGGA